MITIIPIEPLSEAHGALIVKAFNMLFIDRGGQPDGYGDGYVGGGLLDGSYGTGRGNGFGAPASRYVPEEWRVE